jgi:hypothetical protein
VQDGLQFRRAGAVVRRLPEANGTPKPGLPEANVMTKPRVRPISFGAESASGKTGAAKTALTAPMLALPHVSGYFGGTGE